jgi:hypothetical protein
LPEPPGHGSVAGQKIHYLLAGEARQDAMPFLEHRTHLPSIVGHPALQISASHMENAAIAAEFGRHAAVLREVYQIGPPMSLRSYHPRTLGGG